MRSLTYEAVQQADAEDASLVASRGAIRRVFDSRNPRQPLYLFITGTLIGLFFGAVFLAQKRSNAALANNSSTTTGSPSSMTMTMTSIPTTPLKTSSPITLVTLNPTLEATISRTFSPSTVSLPRLPPYEIPQNRKDDWKAFREAMQERFKGYSWGKVFNQSTFTDEVCPSLLARFPDINKPTYEFPPKADAFPPSENPPNLGDLIEHVRRYRYAVADHNHFFDLSQIVTMGSMNSNVTGNLTVDRVAERYYDKLQGFYERGEEFRITWGFMGTSVMSGQDNCYQNTLAPLMKRSFSHMFAPLQPYIDVRNRGQNGNSQPDQINQLLCSRPSFNDELDFLHLWYPMMPQAPTPIKAAFLRDWFEHTKLAFVTDTGLFSFEEYHQAGFVTDVVWGPRNQFLDWTNAFGAPEGVYGDNACRMRTRENIPGYIMESWHVGPMGFQFLVDGFAYFHALAMERAIEWYATGKKAFTVVTPLPSFPAEIPAKAKTDCENIPKMNESVLNFACLSQPLPSIACMTGSNPVYGAETDLVADWNGTSKRDPELNNTSPWVYNMVKTKSTIHFSRERGEMHYKDIANCSDFLDTGYLFQTRTTTTTDWLEFTFNDKAYQRFNGYTTLTVSVCSGIRGAPTYIMQTAPGWVIDFTIAGQLMATVPTTVDDMVAAMCTTLNQDRPWPILPKAFLKKFAIRFRKTKDAPVTDTKVKEISIGLVLFIAQN